MFFSWGEQNNFSVGITLFFRLLYFIIIQNNYFLNIYFHKIYQILITNKVISNNSCVCLSK